VRAEWAYLVLTLLDCVLCLTGAIALVALSRKAGDLVALAVCVAMLIRLTIRHIIQGLRALAEQGFFMLDVSVIFTLFMAVAIVWLIRDLVRLRESQESDTAGDSETVLM